LLVSSGRWNRTLSGTGAVACGQPPDGTKLRIVDPLTQSVCADGEAGEIQVAGPGVAQGYWNHPIESSQVFATAENGVRWLRTGDLGSLREGQLYVTGRIKDLLIVRGAKHFPQDLERTVERHDPAIRMGGVAAVAVGSHVRGDRIALIAEIEPRALDDFNRTQLLRDLRQVIADTHGIQLSGIALVPPGTVPKTTSGKTQRFLCRDAWLNDTLGALATWKEAGEAAPL
jgi:acyl-CoA synthetase (AMP-forming)/AMP-acid ligase II